MPRHGYLIVSNEHRLFPSVAVREIESRAQAIVDAITAAQPILPRIEFKLTPVSLGGRSEAKVAEVLFSGGLLPDVRVVFSRTMLSPRKLAPALQGSKLCVLVTEREGGIANVVHGSGGPIRASFVISEEHVDRLLEELIVDITLGNFFSESEPIRSLIAREGLTGLFKKKVAFVRTRLSTGWLDKITRSAGYVTFGSLDNLPLADVGGRGRAVYQRWLEFGGWLEQQSRGPSQRTRRAAARLRAVRGLGGQLPLAKIEKALAKLSEGRYALVILTSASVVRKSPSLRHQIRSVFGRAARRNAFILLAYEDFEASAANIRPLLISGHLTGLLAEIRAEEIDITSGGL